MHKPFSLICGLIVLYSVFFSTFSIAGEIDIGVLPVEHCDPNETSGVIEMASPDSPGCRIKFTNTENSPEIHAVMFINKKLVKMTGKLIEETTKSSLTKIKKSKYPQIGDKSIYKFHSSDNKISAKLKLTISRTTCNIQTDGSCCGSDSIGTLSATTKSAKKTIQVATYDGG